MFDLSTDEITDGPLHRALLVLAAPLLVQNAVRMTEQIVDLFWVGRYSGDAVAAIGLASPILGFLLVAVITTSFVGTQVLVSQRIGADDQDGARRAAFSGFVLAVVLSAVVGGLVFVGVGPLLEVFERLQPGDSGEAVTSLAQMYLEVLALGIVFTGISDVIEGAFIGRGDSRASLYLNVTAVAVNLVLDPILIFGYGPVPELGMTGAGLASVCGWAAGCLLGVALVARGRAGWIVTRESATLDADEFRELLDVGLPAGVQDVASTSASMVMTVVVFVAAGGPGLAAYVIGIRVSGVVSRATMALRQSTQSVVGMNLGADKPERARRATWTGVAIATGALTVAGAAVFLSPGSLVRFLVPDVSGEGFDLATTFLRILAIGFPALGARALLMAGLNGARRTKTTMIASMAEQWALQIPIAAVGGLVLSGGILVVYWSRTLSILVGALALGVYYVTATRNGLLERAAKVASSDAEATPGD